MLEQPLARLIALRLSERAGVEARPHRGRVPGDLCGLDPVDSPSAGLREGAYRQGAQRGRVPLEQLTRREQAIEILTTRPRI